MGCQSSTERASRRPGPGWPGGFAADFFTSSHKEQPVHSQAEGPLVAPQESPSAPEKDKSKEKNGQVSSSGLLSRANPGFSSGGYNVTALATSSLVGLVQTIKDHITKPTAMARGRVAHLIEWKGWRASQAGWDPTLTGEELYADLTDELKEARFAAGVAEQFAITEATLSAWSSLEEREMDYGGATQEVVQLQAMSSRWLTWLSCFPVYPHDSEVDQAERV
ncbi:protein FAM131C isoform X4 [Pogona vitticeps]